VRHTECGSLQSVRRGADTKSRDPHRWEEQVVLPWVSDPSGTTRALGKKQRMARSIQGFVLFVLPEYLGFTWLHFPPELCQMSTTTTTKQLVFKLRSASLSAVVEAENMEETKPAAMAKLLRTA